MKIIVVDDQLLRLGPPAQSFPRSSPAARLSHPHTSGASGRCSAGRCAQARLGDVDERVAHELVAVAVERRGPEEEIRGCRQVADEKRRGRDPSAR